MNPTTIETIDTYTKPNTARTAAPDIDAWAQRLHVMLQYGSAPRPENPLGLPRDLAKLQGDVHAQIDWVKQDMDTRALPAINGGFGVFVHNGGGNELDDSPRHMDLDQWADAEEAGFGGVLPALVGWAKRNPATWWFYVGTVEDDLNRLIASGQEAKAYERALRTLLPLIHAGVNIGFDAAALYEYGSFGDSLVGLCQRRGVLVAIEALPHPGPYVQWQHDKDDTDVWLTVRDDTYRSQLQNPRRKAVRGYNDSIRKMPTMRWAVERGGSLPENLERERRTVREILEDGHHAVIPHGCILFKEYGYDARAVAEGVAG